MSIQQYIKRAKDSFTEYKIKRIKDKARQLEEEKIRQGRIATANATYQKQHRDLTAIKGYNTKVESTQTNRLKQLGEKLAQAQKNLKSVKNPKGTKKEKLRAERRGLSFGSDTEVKSQYQPQHISPFNMQGRSSPFNQGMKKKSPFNL